MHYFEGIYLQLKNDRIIQQEVAYKENYNYVFFVPFGTSKKFKMKI